MFDSIVVYSFLAYACFDTHSVHNDSAFCRQRTVEDIEDELDLETIEKPSDTWPTMIRRRRIKTRIKKKVSKSDAVKNNLLKEGRKI